MNKEMNDEIMKTVLVCVGIIVLMWVGIMGGKFLAQRGPHGAVNGVSEWNDEKVLHLGESWRSGGHTPQWYYSGFDSSGVPILTQIVYAGNGGASVRFRVPLGSNIYIFNRWWKVDSFGPNKIRLKEVN